MYHWFRTQRKKYSTIVLAIFVIQIAVLIPYTAYAQAENAGVGFPVTITGNLPNLTKETLLAAFLGSLVNATSYMMRKLAYDGARYIASGGKGQGALAFQDGFGAYMEKTGGETFGAMIEQLGEPFGLNLCKPPDIGFQINLQVSLSKIYDNENGNAGPTPPKCNYQSFVENWQNIDQQYSGDALAEKFNASLSVTEGDFGVALQAQGKIDRNIAKAREANLLDRLAGEGFKPVQELISGNVLTPAQTVKEEASGLTSKHQAQMTTDQIAGLYGATSWQIIPTALSIFVNTLASSLLDNILNGGFLPSPSGDGSGIVDQFAQQININRQAAEAAYSYLITGKTIREEGTYDTISRYSACPDNPALDNCVIDNDFVRALEEARVGDPLTIQQAIEKGWLHGNWQLIPPTRTDLNENNGCRTQAYCYSNIQKLRKMRILPLGFEIAALKSNPDQPATLQEVVDGFNACNNTANPNIPPTVDPAYPYCHLIDPNWIVKAPTARSEQKVNGPSLFDQSLAQRQEEYIDVKTCIQTDENGRCISYGYCTQEENTWKLNGDTCPAQYATCQTFTSSQGVRASYLTRTLDYGMCNAESVGCAPYSLEKDANGDWKSSAVINTSLKVETGRNQVAYFNDNLKQYSCPASEDGCNSFVYTSPSGQDKSVFLKKAPDYLGCYDTNKTTQGIQYPKTQSDLALLANAPAQCGNYAGVCLESEVGCESYTPSDGSAALTAVAGNNSCDTACVGYETFRQQATAFDESQFPLYFIPQNGQACSAVDVGCDQFVDLSASTGEIFSYFTDIISCRLPADVDHKTYYTWEGTESDGYVLKKFELSSIPNDNDVVNLYNNVNSTEDSFSAVGSPRYADESPLALSQNYALCNKDAYNLLLDNPYADGAASVDCRKFIDNEGNEYYRLLQELVLIDNACKRYRKVDANVTLAGESFTCSNGGTYNSGNQTCEYWTLARASNTCSEAANQCRAYVGNTGNNIYEVYSTSFEPQGDDADALAQAKDGWTGNTSIEPEATQVGLYSLRVNNDTASYTFSSSTFKPGAHYKVSFWARGLQPLGVTVSLKQGTNTIELTREPITGESFPAPITTEWQAYTVGPVAFTLAGDADTDLVINSNGNSDYYLDNVRVVSAGGSDLEDYVYLIKNSWKTSTGADVPQVCDATPLDQFPGAALGCREYTRRDNTVVTLTGFQNLCRAEAVGCTPLVDEHNRFGTSRNAVAGLEGNRAAYNLYCQRPPVNRLEAVTCNATINGENFTCDILRGEDGCYIEGPVNMDDVDVADNGQLSGTSLEIFDSNMRISVTKTTQIIPADSDSIYLTQFNLPENKTNLCSQQYVGCQEVAREKKVLPGETSASYEFSSGYYTVKNPAHYPSTLCVQEQLGCERFSRDGGESYFKDPVNANTQYCVYRDNVEKEGQIYDGWFLDGIGTCTSGDYCRQDSDCGAGNTCNNVGTTACYPNYIEDGPTYGVWSNGSVNYDGRVAVCDAQYSGCTEYIDPANVSGGPEGASYYRIKDQTLFSDIDSCNGKVNQKDGCILLDDTSNPNKSFNSNATYANSENISYGLVDPVSGSATVNGVITQNDTNTLVKVGKDRQCSEWLACRSAVTELDASGKYVSRCYEYDACSALNNDGTCATWVDYKEDIGLFDEQRYISRETGWNNPEYSGYSLFDKRNPADYVYILNNADKTDDYGYLAYRVQSNLFNDADETTQYGCSEQTDYDGSVCGADNNGRCYQHECIYPVDGKYSSQPQSVPAIGSAQHDTVIDENIKRMLKDLDRATCKAYPQKESPFAPFMVLTTQDSMLGDKLFMKYNDGEKKGKDNPSIYRTVSYSNKSTQYRGASICQVYGTSNDAKIQNCSCQYVEVTYGNGVTDYWPTEVPNINSYIPVGICDGAGELAGMPCDNDTDCSTDGVVGTGRCSLKKSETYAYGLKGLCLEYDRSRPISSLRDENRLYDSFACLTWLPIEVSTSKLDVYNSNKEAGYYPSGLDSQNGGKAYCARASNNGAGYYDRSMRRTDGYAWGKIASPSDIGDNFYLNTSITITKEKTSQQAGGCSDGSCPSYETTETTTVTTPLAYSDIFDETTLSYNGNTYDRGTNAYALQMESSKNKPFVYTALQAWAWRNLGQNARVLRVDMGGSNSDYYTVGTSFPGLSGANAYIWNFAPIVDSEGAGDTGTLMHPPRTWQRDAENKYTELPISWNSSNYNFVMYAHPPGTYHENTHNDEHADFDYVETTFLSPDVNRDEARIYTDKYVEPYLTERDLDQVYFVPMEAPDGAEGNVPLVYVPQIAINFSALNNADGVSYLEPVLAVSGEQAASSESINIPHPGVNNFGGKIFTYKLTYNDNAEKCHGLLSYCDYGGYDGSHPPVGPYATPSSLNNEKNKIAARYVVLFYKEDASQDFISITQGIKDPLDDNFTDPFQQYCTAAEYNNWLAIGMDFNKDGEFLGYISRYCNGHQTQVQGSYDCQYDFVNSVSCQEDNAIRFATIATLSDRCIEYVAVTGETANINYGDNNKAWTDRVWEYAKSLTSSLWPYKEIDIEKTIERPYGSVPSTVLSYEDIAPGATLTSKPDAYGAPRYLGYPDLKFGVPYSCEGTVFDDSNSNYFLFNASNRCPYSLRTDYPALTTELAELDVDGKEELHKLFKKFYQILDVTKISGAGSISSDGVVGPALVEDKSSELNGTEPPKIFATNIGTCTGYTGCTPGLADAFTINDRNYLLPSSNITLDSEIRDSIQKKEDKNFNNVPDPIIAEKSYAAKVRFFAFADDNHMPIRRVMVDWQDGTHITNQDIKGLYKNRKPYCENSNNYEGRCKVGSQTTQLTCATSEECRLAYNTENATCESTELHFGDADRACTENYFEYFHMYYCNASDPEHSFSLSDLGVASTEISKFFPTDAARVEAYNALADRGLKAADTVCLYQPRVQVLDNWGWCNGSCVKSYTGASIQPVGDSTNGCYDLTSVEGSTLKVEQCKFVTNSLNDTNPWTKYEGAVIVIP